MPVIGEEAAIDKVANKRGTTRTGSGLEAPRPAGFPSIAHSSRA